MAEEPSLLDLVEQLRILRIQEGRVLDQIERITARAEAAEENNRRPPGTYRVGDRVRVTNGVRPGQLSTAVVTRVNGERISITTSDGTRTWRLSSNLERR